MEVTNCPSIDKWVKKLWYVYTMENQTTKKNEILLFVAAWVELEVSYMCTLMNKINKDKIETGINTENRLMADSGKGLGGLGEKGKEIKKYKLVVTEQSQRCKLQHKEYSQ